MVLAAAHYPGAGWSWSCPETWGRPKIPWASLKWLLSWLPPLSPAQFDLLHFYIRKTVGHFGNYAFLYFLMVPGLPGQPGPPPGAGLSLSLALCLILALLDEGHQAMFASRSGSLRDVALDMVGPPPWPWLPGILALPGGGPQIISLARPWDKYYGSSLELSPGENIF